jgi:hypothetical protein
MWRYGLGPDFDLRHVLILTSAAPPLKHPAVYPGRRSPPPNAPDRAAITGR